MSSSSSPSRVILTNSGESPVMLLCGNRATCTTFSHLETYYKCSNLWLLIFIESNTFYVKSEWHHSTQVHQLLTIHPYCQHISRLLIALNLHQFIKDLMKWYLKWITLVYEWNAKFLVRWITLWLSLNNMQSNPSKPNSFIISWTQINSLLSSVAAIYSASIEFCSCKY